MLWVSYGKFARNSIQAMITKPENRANAISNLLEALGGKLLSYYVLLNGDIDFVIVSDIPDDKLSDTALIAPMLVRGSGAIESLTHLPALTAEGTVPQMEKAKKMAAEMAYKSPAQP